MLASAIQKHDAALPPRKPTGTTLSQTLFPSSSPVAAPFEKNSPPLRQPPTNVLKPSSSSALNGPRGQGRFGTLNPSKRPASQLSGMGNAISSRKDNSIDSSASPIRNTKIGFTQTSSLGLLGKLHEEVYFDENDFEDDADLNFDSDDLPQTVTQLSSKSITSLFTAIPALPVAQTHPTSSAPVPWSSSPFHHRAPLPNTQSLKRTIDITQEGDLNTSSSISYPAKRRTIPWLSQESEHDPKEPPPRAQPIIKDAINRKSKAEFDTPLFKDKSDSLYPWNKATSTIKEEQKKYREHAQQGKRLTKTRDGNQEEIAKAKARTQSDAISKVFLSNEQRRVLKLVVVDKKSIFFTGSAGTGKSVLMREIIKVLKNDYKREPDRIAITASTGLAACNIGGVTLHSFAGIGLGKEAVPELVKKIKKQQKAKTRWLRTKVLIIDEISMIDGELFDKLEAVARAVRNNGRPFGGIQLVITGDFFQLPPVPDFGKSATFAFDAAAWATSIAHTIGLTQVFRQKDPVFANMLNEMRLGRLTPQSIKAFYALNKPKGSASSGGATELFSTRNEVEVANNARLRNLKGDTRDFVAVDSGSINDVQHRTKLLSNCMAPIRITLKVGAQVMLIKNMDDTLVNGSIGIIRRFSDELSFNNSIATKESRATEDMDSEDEETSLSVQNIKAMGNKEGSRVREWPVVRFCLADGSRRELLCQPESWKMEQPNGEILAQRMQVPLILAWALSIHKAQGQTLERVKVDLGKIFEKGQAYVALSRATCQEGLHIIGFDPKKVMAHEKVRAFYDRLYNVDQASSTGGRISNPIARVQKAKGNEATFMGGNPFEDDDDALLQMYGH